MGSVRAKTSLDEALNSLAELDNIVIQNPQPKNGSSELKMQLTEKIVALVHWGRSGTGLLHSLIDGHPQVSTLPSIYLSEYFDHSNWEKIISDGWGKIVENFMAIYDVLFDAASAIPVKTKGGMFLHNIGRDERMTNVGDQRDEVLSVDKAFFKEELFRLMNFHGQLDAILFFKLVHKAYDTAIRDFNQKRLIFYHIHNPDTHSQLNFVRQSPKSTWVMMVRCPLQACESWLNKSFARNNHSQIVGRISTMLFEIDNAIYEKQNAIGVRLEDLKQRPNQTIPALCDWMGIDNNKSLYVMTAQGKRWWGDPSSPDFEKDGMKPFGKTSINREIGSLFSDGDQYILKTLFYPFSLSFGYVQENKAQFEIDLKKIRPMLDELFDFEKVILERTNTDQSVLVKSGSFLLIKTFERWCTFNKFGTYPNMINYCKFNLKLNLN